MNKKKRKRKARLIIIICLIAFCILLYFLIFSSSSVIKKNKPLETIKGYGYTLEKRDSKLMKDTFHNLKGVLTADEVDYDKYAEYLSELFVIDLYTIKNKKSKNDVGGAEYVYKEVEEAYKAKVSDTIYDYMAFNKKLPEVSLIEKAKDVEETKYTYKETEYDGYEISLKWEYKKELGYDNTADITLVKIGKKLYVAEFVTEEA